MYLVQSLQRAAQVNGDGPASIDGARRQTWRGFADRVARLAGALRGLGVAPGDRVAMLSLNSDRFLEYYFAVPWAGAVIVPLNFRWSRAEIAYVLTDADIGVLMVDGAFVEVAAVLRAEAPELRTVIRAGEGAAPPDMLDYERLIADAPPCAPVDRDPEDVFGIFYTGGTTGVAKGVMLSTRGLWANVMVLFADFRIADGEVFLHVPPMFHLADGIYVLAITAAAGTHVVIPRFDAAAVVAAVRAHGVTALGLVPTMLKAVIEHPDFDPAGFATVRRIIYGAAPMSETLLRAALERLPGVSFAQAFGQTELSPIATVLKPEHHTPGGAHAGRLRSVGQAVHGTAIRIVDAARGELPAGEVGEIAVRGPGAMLGYWRKPAETAAALAGGWVYTGDAGYLDAEGFLYVVDRIKDMVISGGENVYSVEVEHALLQHPAVSACAVIGIPHERWGEAVHAIVVVRNGATPSEQSLIDHCRGLIAGYKCPRSIELRREPLPLSAAGKVLKRELREPYWRGQPRRIH
jgi:acyl-CoA synthetase (AMP-forming)/AMP-acid ligase II